VLLTSDAKGSPEAAEALAKIGKASIPALTDALKSDKADIRARAVQTLGKIGADAVPVLVDALGDKNVDVRRSAALALAPLRISDKMVVLGLAHAVHDPDQSVRQQSLQALQLLGAGAKLAAPKLVAALKDSDGQNRVKILFVLQNIGEAEEHIVPAAADLLKDGNVGVRQAAVNLLGSQGNKALPHLITALKDTDQNVRFSAVNALQRIPGDIKDALPALVPMLKDGTPFQRRSVVLALGRVGEPAVPTLIGLLKEPDNFTRGAAVQALQMVGPNAKKAVPILSDMVLQDSYVLARRNAVAAIAAIEPDKLNDVFARVKKSNDQNVRLTAYQALYFRVGKKGVAAALPAKIALPHLIDATKDSFANIRLIGVQGLASLGADAKDAVPAVTALLDDPDQRVRTQAQVTLNQIKGK
jgi:HEAT repeat protein